ncbi:MAG: hypothetical protein JWM27_271, partial [Gemmatimonadetes bacterium]|nr:hypothetical protein [Gemmatimonadota bacterium]
MRPRFHLLLGTFASILGLAAAPSARAQEDVTPPAVTMSPAGGTSVTQPRLRVTISYSDAHLGLAAMRQVYLGSVRVDTAFHYSGTGTAATDTGTVTLPLGTTTLTVHVCDTAGICTGEGSADPSAAYTYALPAYAVAVAPDGALAFAPGGSAGLTQAFTVTNAGTAAASFDLTATCGVPLTGCTVAGQTALAAGASASVNVTYGTTAWPGTGRIRLRAVYAGNPAVSDTGTVSVTTAAVQSPAVSVTPDGAALSAAPGTSGLSQVFTVTNPRTTAQSFTTAASCIGAATGCGAGGTLTLAGGASAAVTVAYAAAGAPGAGRVQLVASVAGVGADTGWVDLAVSTAATYTMTVSPHGGSAGAGVGTANKLEFTVHNVGSAMASYNVAVACTGAVGGCAGTSWVQVPGGASTRVLVSYTASALAGAGRVTLRVTRASEADSGWVDVTVAAPAPAAPAVSLDDGNPGPTRSRGGCVELGIGGGAIECGDLRVAAGTPGIRVLNAQRAPVLVYNSQTAHPWPTVAADVAFPTSATLPDSVTADLVMSGSSTAHGRWSGADWTPGASRRITLGRDGLSLATSVYGYTLQVRAWYGATPRETDAAGTFAVVNNAASGFGAGWWMAGVDRVVTAGSYGVLWVGGDGSTRLYAPAGTQLWVNGGYDGVDSLWYDPGTGRYAQHTRGGGAIYYQGSSGLEVEAVGRLGLGSTFTWADGALLTGITLPHAEGVFDTGRAFALQYANAGGGYSRLSRVVPPYAAAAGDRDVVVGVSTAGDLTGLAYPDGSARTFTYDPAFAHRIATSTDARGTTTAYGFSAASKVSSARTFYSGTTAGAQDVVVTYTAVEMRGFAGVAAAMDTSAVSAFFDGPRPAIDANDYATFWVDRFGAPRRIRDGLGNQTLIYHNDDRFAALPTMVDRPGGSSASGTYGTRMVTYSYYDARGRPFYVEEFGPLGTSTSAGHKYYYTDPRWPWFATLATDPVGLESRTGYDALGNRAWQQVGPDSTRRVRFGYDALGRVAWVQSRRAAAAGEQPEQMEYEGALGNVAAVISPLGVRTEYRQDRIGRDTVVVSPADSVRNSYDGTALGGLLYLRQSTTYDAVDRVLTTVTRAPATLYMSGDPVFPQTPVPLGAQTLTVINTFDERHDLVAVTRTPSPDSAGTGPITTRWKFDPLGRSVTEIAPDTANAGITVAAHDAGFTRATPRDSTVYDLGGNAVRVLSRRGRWATMTYDALGRVGTRITEAVTYPSTVDTVLVPGALSKRDIWHFPRFSPGGDGLLSDTLANADLVLKGDTATFTYDGAGNVLVADNGDARVHRGYYPNGALKLDSLYVRNLADGSFGHAYGISHTYDLAGRLVTTGTPAAFAAADPWWATHTYGYQPQTGALAWVMEASDTVATFAYDEDGRLAATRLANTLETQAYDAGGRMAWERRFNAVGTLMQRDTFGYDVRGKRTRVWAIADSTVNAFNGMGALAWSYTKKLNQTDVSEEAYSPDALANTYGSVRTVTSDRQELQQFQRSATGFERGTGRVVREGRWESTYVSGSATNFTGSRYDASGNRVKYDQWKHVNSLGVVPGAQLQERTRAYYGADEKLRVMDRRTCVFGSIDSGLNMGFHCLPPEYTDRPTWEEYRYDALGRRVLTRT